MQICKFPKERCICSTDFGAMNHQEQVHEPQAVDTTLISRFMSAARRRQGWFRFFVPLDGTAVALEIKIEPSGQVSRLRVSDQQSEVLEAKPRLKSMLIDASNNRLALINLLLEEVEMPWETLRCFRNQAGVVGAIIEAADTRWLEICRKDEVDCA